MECPDCEAIRVLGAAEHCEKHDERADRKEHMDKVMGEYISYLTTFERNQE